MKKFERIFYWIIIGAILGYAYYYYTGVDKNYKRFLENNKRSQSLVDSLANTNDLLKTTLISYENRVLDLDVEITYKDKEIDVLKGRVKDATKRVQGWAADDLVDYLIARYPEIEIPADFSTNQKVDKVVLPEAIVREATVDLMEGDGAKEELLLTKEKVTLTELKASNLENIRVVQNQIITNCENSVSILQESLNSCQALAIQQNTRINVQADQIKKLRKATLRNIGIVATLITIGQLIF